MFQDLKENRQGRRGTFPGAARVRNLLLGYERGSSGDMTWSHGPGFCAWSRFEAQEYRLAETKTCTNVDCNSQARWLGEGGDLG